MTVGRTFYSRELSKIGRRLLLRVLARTTATAVAARCRCSQQVVSRWASGKDRPSPRAQIVLEHVYGIATSSWGEPRVRRSRMGGRRRGSS